MKWSKKRWCFVVCVGGGGGGGIQIHLTEQQHDRKEAQFHLSLYYIDKTFKNVPEVRQTFCSSLQLICCLLSALCIYGLELMIHILLSDLLYLK